MASITLRKDQPFNLDLTLGCGQVFRWENDGGVWTGVVDGLFITIHQKGRVLSFQGAKPEFIRSYFQLDEDLLGILNTIDRDPVIHTVISHCRGLRIIRQPAWECLASYIIATYANIPGIKRRISQLCQCYGESILTRDDKIFSFPDAGAIASQDPCKISACRLGYRAPYLLETARTLADDPGWESRLCELPYEKAKKELLHLKGVGKKVADCVLLFAFGKSEAFPVDVWIQRILQTRYSLDDTRYTYDQFSRFGRSHFGQYAGYAQEYLFCDRLRIMGGEMSRVSGPDIPAREVIGLGRTEFINRN